MGYNATVVVMLDALHEIEKDKDFGSKLSRAITEANSRNEKRDISSGCNANAATVIETHHADHLVPVLMGGNYGYPIKDVYMSYSEYNDEEKLLKRLAEKLGYRVSKKPSK